MTESDNPSRPSPESESKGAPVEQTALESVPLPPTKTPMYQAMHADRYHRQTLIRQIQKQMPARLVCYICGINAQIHRDDTLGFVDLLHNVPRNSDLNLILHTPGGNIDASEKLLSMVRTTVGTGRLRVIIPDFAKSAGTLMALGADKIVMSDTSELGPIDPQITLNDGHGNLISHSILSYLGAYKTHSESLQRNPNDVTAQIMLGKLNPETVKQFQLVRGRAQTLAEKNLNRWMFQTEKGNFTEIAAALMNIERWQTHGQMIGYQDARELGLLVEYLDPESEEWRAYWQLYCLQRLAVKDRQKLFESDYVSLVFDAAT